jgi:hypothetical protein
MIGFGQPAAAARLSSGVIRAVAVQGGGVVARPPLQSLSSVTRTARFGCNAAAPPAFGKAGAPAPCSPRPARGSSHTRPRTGSRSGRKALRASVPVLRLRSLPAGCLAHNRLPVHTGTEPSCRHRFAELTWAAYLFVQADAAPRRGLTQALGATGRIMRFVKVLLLLLVLLPLGSCSYFWFVGYPQEAQRSTVGSYTIIVSVAPTWFLSPELAFGSIHNNTRIDVALLRGRDQVAKTMLVSGEDLPMDHLPVKVVWSKGTVTVTEPKRDKSVSFKVPGSGT